MTWTPEPGEKCWMECEVSGLGTYLIPTDRDPSQAALIPHDIVDVLEAVTRIQLGLDWSSADVVAAAKLCLERCGRPIQRGDMPFLED